MFTPKLERPLAPGSQAGRCLCGNSVSECTTCAEARVLAKCEICGVCGEREQVEKHVRENHMAVRARKQPRKRKGERFQLELGRTGDWKCICPYTASIPIRCAVTTGNLTASLGALIPETAPMVKQHYKGQFCR